MKKFITLYLVFFILCIETNANASSGFVEVDLYIKDHKFNPEVLELPAGKKIRITVHNQDSTIEEFESIDLKREKNCSWKIKSTSYFSSSKARRV